MHALPHLVAMRARATQAHGSVPVPGSVEGRWQYDSTGSAPAQNTRRASEKGAGDV